MIKTCQPLPVSKRPLPRSEYDEDVTHEIEHAKWLEWYLGEDEDE